MADIFDAEVLYLEYLEDGESVIEIYRSLNNNFEDLDEKKLHKRYRLKKQVIALLLEHIEGRFNFLEIVFVLPFHDCYICMKNALSKTLIWKLHIYKSTLQLKKQRLVKWENINGNFKAKGLVLVSPSLYLHY